MVLAKNTGLQCDHMLSCPSPSTVQKRLEEEIAEAKAKLEQLEH